MALFGPFFTVRTQVAADSRFQAACAYVAEALQAHTEVSRRLASLAAGVTERSELSGGSFALDQVYVPRLRPDGFFESHRNYIDVQVIVAGEELMEVQDISRLVASHAYNPERDLIKYADSTDTTLLKMRAGDVAIFFPEDGTHAVAALAHRRPGAQDRREGAGADKVKLKARGRQSA
ncbi:MAG: YhcH/YjgK/YiaL family protein [Lacunisphaera sp.]